MLQADVQTHPSSCCTPWRLAVEPLRSRPCFARVLLARRRNIAVVLLTRCVAGVAPRVDFPTAGCCRALEDFVRDLLGAATRFHGWCRLHSFHCLRFQCFHCRWRCRSFHSFHCFHGLHGFHDLHGFGFLPARPGARLPGRQAGVLPSSIHSFLFAQTTYHVRRGALRVIGQDSRHG